MGNGLDALTIVVIMHFEPLDFTKSVGSQHCKWASQQYNSYHIILQ